MTFFDTADVYGDGRSEQVIGGFLADHPDAGHHRRHQDGPPGRPGARELRRWRTSAPGPTARGATSASTPSTWCSCTARPRRSSTPTRALRRPRHPGRGRRDRGVRRERRDRSTRRSPRSRARTSRPCRSSSTPSGSSRSTRCSPPPGGRRRHHRAGAAGLGPALREVRRRAPRSPPTTTAPTTATAAPSTSARRSPAWTTTTGLRGRAEFGRLVEAEAPTGTTPAQAASRGLCQQPGVTTRHPRRPQRRAGPRATRPPGGCRRWPRRSLDGVRRIYDEHLRAAIHRRW